MNYRDRLKRADEERKRKNRRDSAAPGSSFLTDPTHPGSVYYQHQTNVFSSDDSCSSSSGSSYDSGSSGSSDCGGGSYGE